MNAAARQQVAARLVRLVEAVIPRVNPKTGKVRLPGVQYRHQHFGYALAWLAVTELPANPFFGRRDIIELALKAGEYKFSYQTRAGGYDQDDAKEQGDEWQAYFLLRTMEVLGRERMGRARWRRWARSLARYAGCHGARPFFFSAPNHECWKMLTLDLAGRVLERPDLIRLADFGMSQLLRYQLAPGFWDENRHHGPSMSYNFVMAEPLHMYWKATGRADVRAALERLLDFMVRYALPDGSTSGALDGRVAYSTGRLSQAMTLTPAGRRLNELWREHWAPPAAPAAPAAPPAREQPPPDAASGAAWTVDLLRFAGDGESRPLGQEADGYLVEEHDGNFHALARRQGPWFTALSGVFSDIPKESDNVYRLERQSRMDLWHRDAGLIIGGGQTHRSLDFHLANLYLDTGYFAEVDFGRVAGRFPDTVRATYYPRLANVAARAEASVLELTFGHAQAAFALRPISDSELAIEVALESVKLRRAFAGIPLVLARGAKPAVDGKPLAGRLPAQVPVRRKVTVDGSFRGAGFEVELPAGARARLNAPVATGFAHFPKRIKVLQQQLYTVALLAVELDTQGPALSGPIIVRVVK